MVFTVIDVMNVKCTNTILMSKTILTGEIISFSNLMPKSRAKLFGVANIKAVSSFAGKGNAIRAIHSIVSALYETHGLGNRIAAAVTRDSDCIVMPIVTTASLSGFGSKFTFAFMRTKVELNSFKSAFLAFYIFAAVRTLYCDLKRFCPMAWQKLSWSTPIIERG